MKCENFYTELNRELIVWSKTIECHWVSVCNDKFLILRKFHASGLIHVFSCPDLYFLDEHSLEHNYLTAQELQKKFSILRVKQKLSK